MLRGLLFLSCAGILMLDALPSAADDPYAASDDTETDGPAPAPVFDPARDAAADAEDPRERVRPTFYAARVGFFFQDGRGIQSQATDGFANPSLGGDERLFVFQALQAFGMRARDGSRHTATVPVDILTAASPDALDAISTASRINESAGLQMNSAFEIRGDHHLRLDYGFNVEETLRTGNLGGGYAIDLAQDNTTLAINGLFILDFFDGITVHGFDPGVYKRRAATVSGSITQVLSPTTLGIVTYGMTHQWGILQQTWNATPERCPVDQFCNGIFGELFPSSRTRHAISGELAQHLRALDGTLRLRYRYYQDDTDVRAHTARVRYYQWLAGHRAWVSAFYRFHDQTAIGFWTPDLSRSDADNGVLRSSDSDLAEFYAQEVGLSTRIFSRRRHVDGDVRSFELAYVAYWRSTGMNVHILSTAFERQF